MSNPLSELQRISRLSPRFDRDGAYDVVPIFEIPRLIKQADGKLKGDILPTGFECGVLNGKVQPGSTVAIVSRDVVFATIRRNIASPGRRLPGL